MFNKNIVNEFKKLLDQIEAEYLISLVNNEIKETQLHKNRLNAVKKIFSILKNLNFEIKKERVFCPLNSRGDNLFFLLSIKIKQKHAFYL